MSDKIYVACATDVNYLLPTAIMLYSLGKNTRFPIEVFVLYSSGDIEKLKKIEIKFPNLLLHFIRIENDKFRHYKVSNRINQVSYYRLVLGDILPQNIKKIIYLDTDLIVCSDIKELWDYEIKGKIIGAVPDVGYYTRYVSSEKAISLYKDLKIPKKSLYFNAGVLLIDIDMWKRNQSKEKIDNYLLINKDYVNFHDQDGLNAILWKDWYRLDYSWNVISDLFYDSEFAKKELGDKKYNETIKNPRIIHFTGHIKPWDLECVHYYKEKYLKYQKKVLEILY